MKLKVKFLNVGLPKMSERRDKISQEVWDFYGIVWYDLIHLQSHRTGLFLQMGLFTFALLT